MNIELTYFKQHEETLALNPLQHKQRANSFMVIADGEYSVTFIDSGETVTARGGEIAFLPTGVEFTHKVISAFTGYNISFAIEDTSDPLYQALSPGKIVLPPDEMNAILRAMDQIAPLPHNRRLLEHIAERIIVENYLFCRNERVNAAPLSEEVREAVAYMRRNLSRRIDIDELAERVYLSHNGLLWKFKKELGATPSDYLKLLRLRNAKDLLLNENFSITRVSEMCGYSSPYYFTNVFHRHYGMSPTEFRRLNSESV